MQNAHKECDGIPEYINYLEDAPEKAEREKVPITDTILMIIVTNTMLTTGQHPRANDEWGDLTASNKSWAKLETTYRIAAKKESTKAQPLSGKDIFGAANEATEEDMNPPMTKDSMHAME